MLGQSKMKSKLILFNPINAKPLKNPAFTIHHVRVLILKFFKQIKLNLINVAREKKIIRLTFKKLKTNKYSYM